MWQAKGPGDCNHLRFGSIKATRVCMATWTKADRGLAIGLLVGALTVGSASSHLVNAFGGVSSWQSVMVVAAASALLAALIGAVFIRKARIAQNRLPSACDR